MKRSKATGFFILAIVLLIVAYDVLALVLGWQTVSGWVMFYGPKHYALPFAIGILGGHLVWPMKLHIGKMVRPLSPLTISVVSKKYRKVSLAILVTVVAVLVVLGFMRACGEANMLLVFLVGVPSGHWGWPQFKDVEGVL